MLGVSSSDMSPRFYLRSRALQLSHALCGLKKVDTVVNTGLHCSRIPMDVSHDEEHGSRGRRHLSVCEAGKCLETGGNEMDMR